VNVNMEVVCSVVELKPGSLERVRKWASLINERKAEVLETLVNEGVTVENFFLVSMQEKDYLIGYMRAGSIEKAHEVVKSSLMEIDVFHQQFKKDTWGRVIGAELLVNLSRISDEESYV
jgi:hypothetical protein